MEEAAGSIPASSTNIFTKLGGTTGITPVPKIRGGSFLVIGKLVVGGWSLVVGKNLKMDF
jgi:hypothetical protein